MTPGERLRSAQSYRDRAVALVRDALDAAEVAAQDLHYARFIETAASRECPTCGALPGSYCAIWETSEGTFYSGAGFYPIPDDRLIALFLHPARSTTPEALFAASLP